MTIETIDLSNLIGNEINSLKIINFEEPPKRTPGEWVKSVDEMLIKIRERTNVI